MARTHIVVDVTTGQLTSVPYTAAEEAQADIDKAADDAVQAPLILQQQRTNAVKLNARRQALVAAIQNNDDAGLIAAAQARYPSLSGDAAKFAVDVLLLIAGQIRS